jgi:bifunctional ADP-heptose synthase (sugar kinase/adenylyltransferase)
MSTSAIDTTSKIRYIAGDRHLLRADSESVGLSTDLEEEVANIIKGADYTVETVVGSELVSDWGGRVELIALVPDQSSSKLIALSQGNADVPSSHESG